MTESCPTCTSAERYSADAALDVGYLDVMPCGTATSIRTIILDTINIDVDTHTGEVTGIEFLTLDSPLARWVAQAAEALYRLEGLDK